jgi:hypothetical protein
MGSSPHSCATKEIKNFILKVAKTARADERERYNQYIAYCECSDALERKELYPNQATYYCFGCDKIILVEKKIP